MIAPTSKTHATSENDPSPAEEFPTRASILEELERICVNPHFRGSTRGKQFLTYVVQNAIEGRTEMLKERVIGAVDYEGRHGDVAQTLPPAVEAIFHRVRVQVEDPRASRPAHAMSLTPPDAALE